MERLVIKSKAGSLYYNDDEHGVKLEPHEIGAHQRRLLLERLHAYEDAGLTPDQIRELKERDTAKPLMERHYEEPGEKPYIKYTCPNGCKIQPLRKSKFCSLCGQRLKWED